MVWTPLRSALLGWLLLRGAARDARTTRPASSAHEKAQIERIARPLRRGPRPAPGLRPGELSGRRSQRLQGLAGRGRRPASPTLVFAVADAGGRDLVDCAHQRGRQGCSTSAPTAARSRLNPGLYTLRFEAKGYVTQEQQVLVREAEKQRIVRVTLQPQGTGLPPASGRGCQRARPRHAGTGPRQRGCS
jgi:hypothetical protein